MSRLARAPERSSPRPAREALGGRAAHVLGERADAQLVVGRRGALASATTRPSHGWGRRWSVPFIQRIGPDEQVALLLLELADAAQERLGVVGHAGAVAVAQRAGTRPARWSRRGPTTRTRCGRSPRARPATPPRARSRTGAGAAASGPRGRTCRAGSRPPWRRRSGRPPARPSCRLRTSVSPDTRNSSGSAYQGPIATRPAGGQGPQALLGLGADLEVVVDHRHLAVEQEVGVGRIGLELGEQLVEQVDEPQPERLERRVPLPVPVGVRDDVDATGHGRTVFADATCRRMSGMAPRLKLVDPTRRPGPLRRALSFVGTTKLARVISRRVFWKLDPILLRLTGGRRR